MTTLYAYANKFGYMVAGTGNLIEDFGIGFLTKGGDGCVDISPIGDMTKTEVFKMARYLGVPESIQKAKPTDGLWPDNRGDEDAIGATYPELEKAMAFCRAFHIETLKDYNRIIDYLDPKMIPSALHIYLDRHEKNAHKMMMPPICYVPDKE
jgi:NAD+ synthase